MSRTRMQIANRNMSGRLHHCKAISGVPTIKWQLYQQRCEHCLLKGIAAVASYAL